MQIPCLTVFSGWWDSVKHLAAGGFPYSEGIFEDMNKAIYSQFYWQSDRKAYDTLREYVAFEYSPDVVDEVIRAIGIMEQNHCHTYTWNDDRKAAGKFVMESTGQAQECLDLLRSAEKKLTAFARQSWRWRILVLRADKIDNEIRRVCRAADGKPQELL